MGSNKKKRKCGSIIQGNTILNFEQTDHKKVFIDVSCYCRIELRDKHTIVFTDDYGESEFSFDNDGQAPVLHELAWEKLLSRYGDENILQLNCRGASNIFNLPKFRAVTLKGERLTFFYGAGNIWVDINNGEAEEFYLKCLNSKRKYSAVP